MSESFYLNRTFIDFDELVEEQRKWDLDISQLQRGTFTNSFEQLSTGDILISSAQFGGHTHQTGSSPPGRTFAVLDDSSTYITWNKHRIGHDSLMIFPAGGGFDVTTPLGLTKVITFSVTDKFLVSMMTEQAAEIFMGDISKNEVVTLPARVLQLIRHRCREYFNLVREHRELTQLTSFQKEISNKLLAKITESLSRDVAPQYTQAIKYDLWDRIDEKIQSSAGDPIQVNDLCLVAQVSERTLHRYFLKRFGIPPKKYINLVRLNRVRATLKRTRRRKGTITNIANNWGFWHMGQFAKDYYRLFEELPSDTLNKSQS